MMVVVLTTFRLLTYEVRAHISLYGKFYRHLEEQGFRRMPIIRARNTKMPNKMPNNKKQNA